MLLLRTRARLESQSFVACGVVGGGVSLQTRLPGVRRLATLCLVVMLPGRRWSGRLQRATVVGVLTGVLLAGPVYSIHHFAGLGFYLRSNVESTRHEAERTDCSGPLSRRCRDWPPSSKRGERRLVDLLRVPAAAGRRRVRGLLTRPRAGGSGRRWIPGAAGDAGALRGGAEPVPPSRQPRGTVRRLGAPMAVLGAWLDRACRRVPGCRASRGGPRWRARGCDVSGNEHDRERMAGTRDDAAARRRGGRGRPFVQVATELGRDAARARRHAAERDRSRAEGAERGGLSAGLHGSRAIASWCSPMTPEVAAFAARAFAGGHPTFRAGFYTLPEDQALTVERLDRQPVPIVLTRDEADYHQHIETAFKDGRRLGRRARTNPRRVPALTDRRCASWCAATWPGANDSGILAFRVHSETLLLAGLGISASLLIVIEPSPFPRRPSARRRARSSAVPARPGADCLGGRRS